MAHRRLVDIHPFNDGNGRTARLVMNLILIRGGYPPAAVRPEDRLEYIRSLQQKQAGQGAGNFNTLLYRRLDVTLGCRLQIPTPTGWRAGAERSSAVEMKND
jgi:Fic family protein